MPVWSTGRVEPSVAPGTGGTGATAGTVLQLGVEPNRIDLLTRIEPLEFGPAWSRREASTYGGVPIPVLGLDDLITAKRAAGRAQDLLDADWLEKARRGRR